MAMDLIRREEQALGIRCKACGQPQELPTLAPGTMVESTLFEDRKVGPIASSAVIRAYGEKYRTFVRGRVAFIDLKSGALCFRERKDVTVIHGYVHIVRPSTIISQERF